jgi:hypothetical protein
MENLDYVLVPIKRSFRFIFAIDIEVTQPPTHPLNFEQEIEFLTW